MLEIKTKGEAVDLPSGFSIEIEDSNPIFNDIGSQSIPATVPATRRNIRLLDAPYRIDSGEDPNLPERKAEVVEGAYRRTGSLNITEAGKGEGITFNVGFDNSTAYMKWRQRKLSEISGLPVYTPGEGQGTPVYNLLDELYRNYREADPQATDFAVFPVAINKETDGSGSNEKEYWEILNVPTSTDLRQPATVKRLIDGTVTEVSIPQGYMVSPFLRVWRVLEFIFEDLELIIRSNPFKEDRELSRLVILNNAADSVCLGKIRYSDLMPDSTVEEFLNALWVRFGLVYHIDYTTGEVSLKLLKDILDNPDSNALDGYSTAREKITYDERQYIKLTAATGLEGAAPATERFEDFIKGLDVTKVHMGTNVKDWRMTGSQNDPKWDGDVGEGYYDQDEYDPWEDPDFDDRDDWWDDRDDDRDYYSTRSEIKTLAATSSEAQRNTFLAREFVTGLWYKLDATNGTIRQSSTSNFDWDPQPEGITAYELSSDDEFIALARVANSGTGTGNTFNAVCPLFLCGCRHYHSYIKESGEDENGAETPLSFAFAYTIGKKTIGRLTPESDQGGPMTLDDGTKPTISLLFQFRDGLFARYWKKYDEILRHGNRSVDLSARINKLALQRMNLFEPYSLKGVRVLIDTMTYALPSGKDVAVDMKLRTIQTQGSYDIDKEQNIPNFASAARHLALFLYKETYGTALDTDKIRQLAADLFDAEGYERRWEGDYYYFVDGRGAKLKSISRESLTWQNDPNLPTPSAQGQHYIIENRYIARLTYDIYEVHAKSIDAEEYFLSAEPIGSATARVVYRVELYSKWVAD